MPAAPLHRYRSLHRAVRGGLVRACHDLSEGGLAVALAEMCIGGRLGAAVELSPGALSAAEFLFSESNGRLLIEVVPEDALLLEAQLDGVPLTRLGTVSGEGALAVDAGDGPVIQLAVDELVHAWKGDL